MCLKIHCSEGLECVNLSSVVFHLPGNIYSFFFLGHLSLGCGPGVEQLSSIIGLVVRFLKCDTMLVCHPSRCSLFYMQPSLWLHILSRWCSCLNIVLSNYWTLVVTGKCHVRLSVWPQAAFKDLGPERDNCVLLRLSPTVDQVIQWSNADSTKSLGLHKWCNVSAQVNCSVSWVFFLHLLLLKCFSDLLWPRVWGWILTPFLWNVGNKELHGSVQY